MSAKLYPFMRYTDPDAALTWLRKAFGFEGESVYRDDKGGLRHAELALGDDMIMFGEGDPKAGHGIYSAVDDLDAVYTSAKAAGATITRELSDTDYGSREFSCRDLDGHAWSIGTYRP